MRITSFLLALSAMLCTIAIEPRAAQISCKEEWGHAASVGWAKTGFPENIGIPGPTEAHCFSIRIEGEIASGDYNAFRLMLKRHEPYAHTVFLISPGGDAKEAIKIGKLIRDRMLSTETFLRSNCSGEQCLCASACFFIWAAGVDRLGDALLIHRPRDVSGIFARKPASQASSEYTWLLSQIADYLRDMEVPPQYFEMMRSTPSTDATSLPENRCSRCVREFIPSLQEWLIADCGSMSREETADYEPRFNKYLAKDYMSDTDQRYFQLLHQKDL